MCERGRVEKRLRCICVTERVTGKSRQPPDSVGAWEKYTQ